MPVQYINFIISVLVGACALGACSGPGLSEEQRKNVAEEKERRKPKKVDDGMLIDQALIWGRAITDTATVNSKGDGWELIFIKKEHIGKEKLSTKEDEVWEAYQYMIERGGTPGENVQTEGDKVIYSLPVLDKEDGQLSGMWFVRIEKKALVLSL